MATSQGIVMRDYRKGNWTVQETMVLIEAKKMDEERRMKTKVGESSSGGGGNGFNKPAELRWKWVEDYCWRNGCLRSQNQCNDKWDNLMRDFKKVRDYERRRIVGGGDDGGEGCYWKMEKHERKERSLPSNMLPRIYEALEDVVEKRGGSIIRHVSSTSGSGGGGGGGGVGGGPSGGGYLVEKSVATTNTMALLQSPTPAVAAAALPPPMLVVHQHPITSPPPLVHPLAVLSLPPQPSPPPAPPIAAAQPHGFPYSQPVPTLDSDTSEQSGSPAKRRKRVGGGEGTSGTNHNGGDGGGGGGTGGGGGGGTVTSEVGNAIFRSASIIAEALQASDAREQARHRELLSLEERRLQLEETKNEVTRQGIHGLVDSINKLANSIFTLANSPNHTTIPPK